MPVKAESKNSEARATIESGSAVPSRPLNSSFGVLISCLGWEVGASNAHSAGRTGAAN